jgi:hypothetical protein
MKKQVVKQTKQLGSHVVKQMATEPLEVLKSAGSQVTGSEARSSRPAKERDIPAKDLINLESNALKKSKTKGASKSKQQLDSESRKLLETNRQELEMIRKQKVYEDISKRIAQGEDVPLENITELTIEQKQVLKAQKEAIKKRAEMENQEKPLVVPQSKKSRGLMPGMKGKLERMKTKREIRAGKQ